MAVAKKRFPPRAGEFKAVRGVAYDVELELNNLKLGGFVDIQGITSFNDQVTVLIYYKPNVVEVPETKEEVTTGKPL
jgi:hypothetical protein